MSLIWNNRVKLHNCAFFLDFFAIFFVIPHASPYFLEKPLRSAQIGHNCIIEKIELRYGYLAIAAL